MKKIGTLQAFEVLRAWRNNEISLAETVRRLYELGIQWIRLGLSRKSKARGLGCENIE